MNRESTLEKMIAFAEEIIEDNLSISIFKVHYEPQGIFLHVREVEE